MNRARENDPAARQARGRGAGVDDERGDGGREASGRVCAAPCAALRRVHDVAMRAPGIRGKRRSAVVRRRERGG